MLIIILSWIYMLITAYCLGVGFHGLLRRLPWQRSGLSIPSVTVPLHFSLNCLSGLLVITFLAMMASLFMPLGAGFQILLLTVAAGAAILVWSELKTAFAADRQRLKATHPLVLLLVTAFVFIIAKISLMPSSHHDDGLYYSTSIRWLQEYGTVKGIANLNARTGFNTSWHILQAALGFRFLHAGLFNDLNGLIFLLMLIWSAGAMNLLLRSFAVFRRSIGQRRRTTGQTGMDVTLAAESIGQTVSYVRPAAGKISWITGLRAFMMLPVLAFHFTADSDVMLFNVNFLESPTADIPVCLLIWVIFLLFLDGRKEGEGGAGLTDGLVIAYSVWVCTIKLSALPILILPVCLLLQMLWYGRIQAMLKIVAASLLFIAPWIIRNIILSGYLVFPYVQLDIFHVDWKVPEWYVRSQERAIRMYTMGADIGKPFDQLPLRKWFLPYYFRQDPARKLILTIVLVATATYFFTGLYLLIRRGGGFLRRYGRELAVLVTGVAGILFWLMEAPDFRFGYGFLISYCMIFVSAACWYVLKSGLRYLVFPAMLYMAALASFYYQGTWTSLQYFFDKPQEYRMPDHLETIDAGSGHVFYLAPDEDTWNAPLPALNAMEYRLLHPVFRGKDIGDGFRPARK